MKHFQIFSARRAAMALLLAAGFSVAEAQAAVDAAVTTAVSTGVADGATIGGLILAFVIGIAIFRHLRGAK